MELLKSKIGKDIYGLIIKYNDNSYENLMNKLEKKYLQSYHVKVPSSIINSISMAVKKGYAGIIFFKEYYEIYNYYCDEINSNNYTWIKKKEYKNYKYLYISNDQKYSYINIKELSLFEITYKND